MRRGNRYDLEMTLHEANALLQRSGAEAQHPLTSQLALMGSTYVPALPALQD